MENSETSNSINEDQNDLSRKFLKITNVKIFSNAYNLRLKEDDIIIGINGEYFNSSYDELRKILDEDENEKIVTILRDEVNFNIKTKKSLGVVCENIEEDHIKNFKKVDFKNYFTEGKFFSQYEIYKDMFSAIAAPTVSFFILK